MQWRKVVYLSAVLLPVSLLSAYTQESWVDAGAYGDMHIVVPAEPSDTLQYAAEIFQKYWQACTGREIRISDSNEGRINVWLGPDVITEDLMSPSDREGLGEEGCIVRTYDPPERQKKLGARKQLLITGSTDRGTLNGVFEFFQRYMGVRWLAPGVTYTPQAKMRMPRIDFRYVPHFSHREVGYSAVSSDADLEYRRAHKLPDRIAPGLFGGHTFYTLLPPDKYFGEHPEYYAEINGQRAAFLGDWKDETNRRKQIGQSGQLCCANPAVADAVLASLIELINADPAAADPDLLARRNQVCCDPSGKVWSVSQMDGMSPCQCSACRAIDEHEGTHMGALLTLVNRVAEGLDRAFPGAGYQVHTLACQYSRKPPKTLRPRDNVIVQLCTVECDFGRPFDDAASPINAAFVRDLAGWAALTESLYVWDYAANLAFKQRPHPNLHVFQANMQVFDQYNVKGVFEDDGELSGSQFGEFAALRSYLLSSVLWDPDTSYDECQADFLKYYYGPAGSYIRDYIALMTDKVRDDGVYLDCFAKPYWLDYELVQKADALFQEALKKELTDDVRQRVALAYLPVQYAALVCPPRIRAEGGKLLLDRPPSGTLDQYIATLKIYEAGVEERPACHPIQDITEECGGITPPRRQEYELITLENERHLVWVVPGLQGAVLRWRDKTLGVELLRGFEHYDACPGTLQEWVNHPHAKEGPVSAVYEVVEQTSDHVALRATLENGLVLSRTMALPSGGDRLQVSLSVTNPTPQPQAVSLKIHPEFYTQGMFEPEIWANEKGAWTRLEGTKAPVDAPSNTLYRKPGDITRWAFRVPSKNLTVVNDFDATQVGNLFFFCNWTHPCQQVNLELILPDTPIASGETRSVTTQYWTTDKKPAEL